MPRTTQGQDIDDARTPEEALPEPSRIADRLHSAAIHLLRKLRQEDALSGLTAPRLSALSVIVFGGPLTIGALADAEQVRPPTISRLVQGLERDGLVERVPDPSDGRVHRVRATAAGRCVLEEGRTRRVEALAAEVAALPHRQQELLAETMALLEQLALPADHPRREG